MSKNETIILGPDDEYNDWIEGRYKKQTLPNIDSLSRESLTNKLFDIITGIK